MRYALTRTVMVVLWISSPLAAEVLYNLTELGAMGGNLSYANTINDSGQIAGVAVTAGGSSAFIYENGQMHDLGIGDAGGYGINAAGHIAGITTLPTGQRRAFVWTPEGGASELPTLNGEDTYASAINDRGEVVGKSWVGDFQKAFLWSDVGGIQDLGGFGGSFAAALDINNLSQVVGHAMKSGYSRAFLYSNGSMIDIGSLYDNSIGDVAMSINDSGQIAGYSNNRDGSQAFLYDNGTMKGLGTLGGTVSWARSINNLGQVVGVSEISPDDHIQHAFVWSGMAMADLNTLIDPSLGWTLTDAWGINNNGEIVGYGKYDGYNRAFLLTPVPEPGTLVLFLLAAMVSRRTAPFC